MTHPLTINNKPVTIIDECNNVHTTSEGVVGAFNATLEFVETPASFDRAWDAFADTGCVTPAILRFLESQNCEAVDFDQEPIA